MNRELDVRRLVNARGEIVSLVQLKPIAWQGKGIIILLIQKDHVIFLRSGLVW
jgi:hypothetical protein